MGFVSWLISITDLPFHREIYTSRDNGTIMTLYRVLWVILYSSISDEHIMIYLVTGTLESSNSIILNIRQRFTAYTPYSKPKRSSAEERSPSIVDSGLSITSRQDTITGACSFDTSLGLFLIYYIHHWTRAFSFYWVLRLEDRTLTSLYWRSYHENSSSKYLM